MTRTPLLALAEIPDLTGLPVTREEALQIAEESAEKIAAEKKGAANWWLGDKAIRLVGPHTGKDTPQQRAVLRWYSDYIDLDSFVKRFADDDREDAGIEAIKDYRRVSTQYPPDKRTMRTAMPYVVFRYVAGKDDRHAKLSAYDAKCYVEEVRPSLRGFQDWRIEQGENVKPLAEASKANYVAQTALNLERMTTEQKAEIFKDVVANNPEVLRTAYREDTEFRRTVAHVSITETQRAEVDRTVRRETNPVYREIDQSNSLEDVIVLIANLSMAQEQFVSQAPSAITMAGTMDPNNARMIQLREALGRWEFRDLAAHEVVKQAKEFATTGKTAMDGFLAGVLEG